MEPPRIAAMRVEQGRGTERVSLARHLLKLTIASSQRRLPACDRFGDVGGVRIRLCDVGAGRAQPPRRSRQTRSPHHCFAAGAAVAQALADHSIRAGQQAHDALALVAERALTPLLRSDGRPAEAQAPSRCALARGVEAAAVRRRPRTRSGCFRASLAGPLHSRRESHPRPDLSASTVPSAGTTLHPRLPGGVQLLVTLETTGSNYVSYGKLS